MITVLIAVAHLYVLPWKMLFMLPAPSEKPCAVTMVRYGAPDGSWESGANPPATGCEFRVSVAPGPLLPAWVDVAPQATGELSVTYSVQGVAKPETLKVTPEKIEPGPAKGADLSAKAAKIRSSVRVELTNKGEHPILVGDAVAARSRPKDDCVGPGPAAVIQPGETLVDQRPGLLSPSMQVWAAVFTGEKACKWVEVKRRP